MAVPGSGQYYKSRIRELIPQWQLSTGREMSPRAMSEMVHAELGERYLAEKSRKEAADLDEYRDRSLELEEERLGIQKDAVEAQKDAAQSQLITTGAGLALVTADKWGPYAKQGASWAIDTASPYASGVKNTAIDLGKGAVDYGKSAVGVAPTTSVTAPSASAISYAPQGQMTQIGTSSESLGMSGQSVYDIYTPANQGNIATNASYATNSAQVAGAEEAGGMWSSGGSGSYAGGITAAAAYGMKWAADSGREARAKGGYGSWGYTKGTTRIGGIFDPAGATGTGLLQQWGVKQDNFFYRAMSGTSEQAIHAADSADALFRGDLSKAADSAWKAATNPFTKPAESAIDYGKKIWKKVF